MWRHPVLGGVGTLWNCHPQERRIGTGIRVAKANDQELIARIKAGDEDAYRLLFERYADPLRKRVERWLPNATPWTQWTPWTSRGRKSLVALARSSVS